MTAPAGRALPALCVGAVLIGLAPIFVRLSEVGPVASAFWRVMLAWPILLLALRVQQRAAGAASPRDRRPWILALAGALFAADLALWHYAINYTSVANATLLANAAPIFVAVASWLWLGERLGRRFLFGLGVAMAGTLILVGPAARLEAQALRGDLYALAAALFYAGYLLTVSVLRRRHSTLEVMTWSSAAAAVCLLPVALLLGEPLWPQTSTGWGLLLGLAVLSHVGGQGLIAYALAVLPASFSSVGLLLQPAAAAGFAWILLAENIGAIQALGAVIVLVGILVCRPPSVVPRS